MGNVAVGELETLPFLPFCTAALVVVNTGDVWTGDVATGCGRSSTIGSTAILALDWLQPMLDRVAVTLSLSYSRNIWLQVPYHIILGTQWVFGVTFQNMALTRLRQ